MPQSKILSALGLAMRAGKLVLGSEAVIEQIRSGKAKAVYYAEDVSSNTEKKFRDCCGHHGAEAVKLGYTMAELSSALGKTCNVSAVCVSDENFYKVISKAIYQEG